jgi:putative effector of murein hydrolase
MKVDEIVMTVFWVLFAVLFAVLGAALGEGMDKIISTSQHIVRGWAVGTVPLAWIGFAFFWRNLTRR